MSSIDLVSRRSFLSSQLFRAAPAVFAATLFLSALLLFAVQPMFTKMVLPKLGGAPAIWSVALVFFQASLLLGYAYAHWLTKYFSPRHGAFIHLGFLGIAALTLPLSIASGFGMPPSTHIEVWLLALFAASIGLPFTALSASAPLLQRWFADSEHPRAGNPYVLYAASNLGSFTALLAYPTVIEPFFRLREQTAAWSAGFALLAVLIAMAALVVASSATVEREKAIVSARPSLSSRLSWIGLAAIPSGLVVAVTAHISTDVAAAPFLWIVPLALYLLTFVAVFNERPWLSQSTIVLLVPFVVAALAITMMGGLHGNWLMTIALHLIGLFVLTLLCHGELYRKRPDPQHLTDFYLATSIGGVVGGVLTGLIAPNVFSTTLEYPMLVALAVLALPGAFAGGLRRTLHAMAVPLAIAVVAYAVHAATGFKISYDWQYVFLAGLVSIAALVLLNRRNPAAMFGFVVLAFVFSSAWQPGQKSLDTSRSFFGVHRVVNSPDDQYRMLLHGTTIHGIERIRNADGTRVSGRPEPLAYYYRGGPISDTILATREVLRRPLAVAAVGLGAGSVACYREQGERWTFFEIDPEVVRIARDPQRFSFLSSCAPDLPIVLGDARLTLAASAERYDVILLDAFSSDAIPAHLLTREAIAGYLGRLKPNGIIVLHISNRHLELSGIVAAVGAAEGLVAIQKFDHEPTNFALDYKSKAQVAVLARSWDDLSHLTTRKGWAPAAADGVTPWTDDYSDLISSMIRKKF
ncbi:MAG TPA: fused MFS/spermidine synthase [Xanthobacteraceae bacterium]|nr:fused MFS/spermidine synthase [Xanthobacteraceae bacterium]